jgi:hypothetical protein
MNTGKFRLVGPRSSARSNTSVVVFAFALLLLDQGTARAHGVIGDRTFLSPIVGNDAFSDSAFSLTGRRSNYEFSLISELEKQLSENSSILLSGGWARINPGTGQRKTNGSTDLSIYFRHAVYKSPLHEMEFTVSPFVVVPVGDRMIPDQGYTHLGGELLLAKGLGDLPHSPLFKYLRPLALQGEASYAGRIQGPANSDVFANLELEYSFEYLDRSVEPLTFLNRFVGLMPYAQFNYSQAFMASRLTTMPDFRLTPGLAYVGEYFELSAGAQVAFNGAAPSGDRVAVIGLVEVFYDDLFPALGWKPF